MLVYCIVEIISYVWNLVWISHLWVTNYFINPVLCKKAQFFKNMEIKSCGLIYNQRLDAEAGDHLNNSHQHVIKFSDELFNLANLSYFLHIKLVYVKILTEMCFCSR